MTGELHLKIGRFIEKVREKINTDLKILELEISNKPRKRKSEHLKLNTDDDLKEQLDRPLDTESWKPKKIPSTYFSLKAIARQLEKNSCDNDSLEQEVLELNNVKLLPDKVEITDSISTSSTVSSSNSEYPCARALDNALYFNNQYYMQCAYWFNNIGKTFTLRIYSYKNNSVKLSSGDYLRFLSKHNQDLPLPNSPTERWISDFGIDALAYSFLKNRLEIYYTYRHSIMPNDFF